MDTDSIDVDTLGFDQDEIDEYMGTMEAPDFSPVDEEEQPNLDETNQTECPECGHEFNPNF
jgi:hypothetical protein